MRVKQTLDRLILASESMHWSYCYPRVEFVVFNVQQMLTLRFQPHIYIGHCHHRRSCRFQCAPSQSTSNSARTAAVSIETRARHLVYIPLVRLHSDPLSPTCAATLINSPPAQPTRTPSSCDPQLSRCGRSTFSSFSSATSLALGYSLGM